MATVTPPSPRVDPGLVGIGLYTVAEAGRLVRVSPSRIARWLRGHAVGDTRYDPLWKPQVDLGEGRFALGFRDLQEIRVAAAFIAKGLSPQRVREAIVAARSIIDDERPLSTNKFRTDGRSVFLQILQDDGEAKLIDLFKGQYAFRDVLERSLTNIDFDADGVPARWWPMGRSKSVVLDPTIAFGQPIEAETAVPVTILAAAASAQGSAEAAARAWDVPVKAVKRAVAFERDLAAQAAA